MGLILVLAAAAAVSGAPAQDVVVPDPVWRATPETDDVEHAYPREAAARKVEGMTAVHCRIGDDGHLSDCRVTMETPAGFGFGQAALSLTGKYRAAELSKSGQPVAGKSVDLKIPSYSKASRSEPRMWVSRPLWASAPSAKDAAKAYASLPAGSPPDEVMFRCDIDPANAFSHCTLIKGPANAAYEDAARPLLARFRLSGAALPAKSRPYVNVAIMLEPMTPPDQAGVLLDATWSQGPTADKQKAAFPAAATKAGVHSGKITLDCVMDASGGLTDCKATEDPKAMGFADAALSLASAMKANPWTEDGRSVEGVHVQFAMELNDAAPPGPPGKPH
jgi:outer membrane biosynthesis protein TonB